MRIYIKHKIRSHNIRDFPLAMDHCIRYNETKVDYHHQDHLDMDEQSSFRYNMQQNTTLEWFQWKQSCKA